MRGHCSIWIPEAWGGLLLALALVASPAWGVCNTQPIALADEAEMATTLIAIDVLANDTDPDGEAVEISLLAGSCHATGNVQVAGHLVTYQPGPGPLTPCSFGYRATDEGGLSDDATVTILVSSGLFADDFESGDLTAWALVCAGCP